MPKINKNKLSEFLNQVLNGGFRRWMDERGKLDVKISLFNRMFQTLHTCFLAEV